MSNRPSLFLLLILSLSKIFPNKEHVRKYLSLFVHSASIDQVCLSQGLTLLFADNFFMTLTWKEKK